MITTLIQFGSEQSSSGGLSSLGINAKGFLFQLITFVMVMLLLKKYVYGKLVDTLEARRQTVLGSLEEAKKAAEELQDTEAKIEKLLVEARQESADIVATAHKEAVAMVEEAETKAQKKAEHIITEAKGQLDQEILKARAELKKETKTLVALATEQIIGQKLTGAMDEKLIEQALKDAN